MKIGIDISAVPYGTGVSVYTKELVRALLKVDKKNEYVLFAGTLRRGKDIKNFTDTLNGNFEVKTFPFPPTVADFVWNRLHIWPVERFLGQIDVFHSSDWTHPPTLAKTVTTIHDLAPLLFPNETDPKIKAVHKRKLKRVKKNVDAVIVPSEATKKDTVKMGVPSKKVYVVEEALRSDFSISKTKPQSKGKYLLTVGTAGRKNIDRTIVAFQKVKADLGIKNMVVVGESRDKSSDGVIFTGHISNSRLESYYSHAEALVYPSLYEGFGLPILEAFASNIPVVASNTSSMPEVAGSAAVLVNPENVDDIAKGIKTAIKNKSKLVEKGKAQLKKFSWDKAAKETLQVYNSLV